MVISIAMQSCVTMKKILDKRSAETTQNTINLLNTLSEEELKIVGIRDRIIVITWARKSLESIIMLRVSKTRQIKCYNRSSLLKAYFQSYFRKDSIIFGMKKVN